MASKETPERPTRSPEVIVISITIADPPVAGGRSFRERVTGIRERHTALAAVAIALSVAVLGVSTTPTPQGRRTSPASEARRVAHVGRGDRAAYRYPLGCLSPAIALHDPRFARAAFERAVCG